MNFTRRITKKLLFILVILALFIWVGVKGYQVAHSHAQKALQHVQTGLQQIVGNHGSYSYSKAHINWLTQSVIVKDIRLTFSNETLVTIRKAQIIPKDFNSVSSLDMENIEVKSPDISATISSLTFSDLSIPALLQKNKQSELSLSNFASISFAQGNMKGAYFYTKWGKFRLGSWRIARQGSSKKRPYLFYNVDIAPAINTGQSASLDALHFDQLIWEMSDDRKFNEKEFFSSFFTSTDFFLKAYGAVGFRDHKKRVSIGQLNIHLSHQGTTWEGEILADRLDYDLTASFSLFAEYLKRLGYENINGAFHSNFTYYTKDSLFSLHKLNYFGYDFLGLYLQSRFYIDKKTFNLYRVNWSNSVLLKSINLSIYDAGLKKRLFSIVAQNSGKTEKQVYDDTLVKFSEFAKGKDFELDRQLYTALADILQNPKQMMQLLIVFEAPERVNTLLNMNFLDFFKLINQNNMTIKAIPKN